MKISAAAVSFLILSAALGTLTHGSQSYESQDNEHRMVVRQPLIHEQGFHRPHDCCLFYTPRKIRCVFMKEYFETASGCSQPGVIFTSKRGQRICANPFDEEVQHCIMNLNLDPVKKLRIMAG